MNYLLTVITSVIKKILDGGESVGVAVVVKIPNVQDFVNAISRMFGSQKGYLVIDGVQVNKLECPKNLELSSQVEKAVDWRNLEAAQGRIVYNCARASGKRFGSLKEFAQLTASGIVRAIASDQASKAQNQPLTRFWEAITLLANEGISFSLKSVLEFLDAIKDKKTGFEKELWRLKLIPDKRILTPSIDVVDRIRRNQNIIEQLNSLDDAIRKRMASSLANFNRTEKKIYRQLLEYHRVGDFNALRDLDLEAVSLLITKVKTHADKKESDSSPSSQDDTPDSSPTTEPVKPQNPNKTLLDDFVKGLSGDEEAKGKIKEFGASIIDYTRDHDPFDDNSPDEKPTIEDPKTGTVITFPLAKIDHNLYKLVMHTTTNDNWGGVVLSRQPNLHDTILDADSICSETDAFRPFRPYIDEENPFFAKNVGLATEFRRFDDALKERAKNACLFDLFQKVVESRQEVMPFLDALLRYGHLAVFGCNPAAIAAIQKYVGAWKALYDEFERVEEDMHEISDKEYQHAARCLLSLDVLFFRVQDEWKAIMLPTNPLFLWIYSEVYGQLDKQEYNFAEEEFRTPFLKALSDLPNLINFQLVPREVYALSDSGANDDYILPCSGSQGILPTFENKTNRYLGSDGMECIEDTISRYLAFAPYAANDLRICVVDVPDVMECVRIVSCCISERKKTTGNIVAATLEIYLTESHSGGRELDNLDFVKQDADVSDLIQADCLRIKVVHCKNASAVTECLRNDPVHLAFYFDQSTYQVSYGANTRELYITPLVVTYDFKYDAISHDGEIFPNTDTSNGFLGSYYGILDKTGSTCSQSRVPRTSYLKTDDLNKILEVVDKQYAQWMIAADRVVYNYVPENGLPIGVKNFGRRNVCIWANKNSRVIQQFILLLKKYNLHPTSEGLVDILNRFGHISGEGLVGIPANSQGATDAANSRRKGMLGTVFAAKWYADQHPGSLIASLDSDEGRTWLSKTENEMVANDRADLVGFRIDGETGGVIIDVLEVKTRSVDGKDFTFSTINGKRVLNGHAPEQVGYVLNRLHQVFHNDSFDTNMFVSARRETLKYQVVNECFRSKYLSSAQVQDWSKKLKQIFAGGCPVKICGTILHVDLENNSTDVPDEIATYEGDSEYDIAVVTLTAGRIQKEIFKDACETGDVPVLTTLPPLPSMEDDECDDDDYEVALANAHKANLDKPEQEELRPSTPNRSEDFSTVVESQTENIDDLVKSFRRACNSFQIRIAECDPSLAKVGPSVIRFYLTLQTGQKIDNLRKSLPDIGRQISHTQLRIQQVENTDKIAVDVVRDTREFVPFENVISLLPESDEVEKMPILIGRTPEGDDILRRLDEMPHLLVGGTTGSGKSVFLSTLLLSLLVRHPRKDQLKLLITSSKPEDFIAFESLPHLMAKGILSSATDAVQYIQNEVFQESERRQQLFIKERVSKISLYNQHMRDKGLAQLPPVVVLVDEFADLADNIDGRDERDTFFRTLRQIAQAGRSRGIHLILCTQRPSSKLLDTNIKAQLPGRVALMVADANSAKMILDTPDSGAERLQGKGDLLFKDAGGSLSRAQGYSLDLDNLTDYVDKIFK